MKLTLVGTGYVGLVTGACFASMGNEVTCLDIDAHKIDKLKRGASPIYEPGLEAMVTRNTEAGRMYFTTDKDLAYREAEVIFICVGTPPQPDGSADLSYVLAVADDIGDAIDKLGPKQRPKVVVVKSTVPVGTTDAVRDRIRERTDAPFMIANNPEFLKEGAAINDFLKPDRVICGVEDERAGEILRDLYAAFVMQGNPIFVMDIRSSEMVKYASNAMLACKISFINEIANLCECYGADVKRVREGMCADHRIGRAFLYPGLGYGGSCFPKDTQAVIGMGMQAGFECQLNRAVHEVNERQRQLFWDKVVRHFGGSVAGRSLAFWGVAFKPETDDIREAPSVSLMNFALESGAGAHAYDRIAAANLNKLLPQVKTFDDMYEALDGCDGLIICTEWSEFRNPDFAQMKKRLKEPVVFDGRNIYRRGMLARAGFAYYSVGRPPVTQGTPVSAE